MMPSFLKRWFGKCPGTIRNKPLRREKWFRPQLEQLEERVLLDSGLPSALVVGKTLSAYSIAAIQNHQETINYTVYNEQAEPVSGVLLTDTLQPGLTIASASQLPDQSGQDLAWSLGTIPGFGRATVSLTVALPEAIPAQLDGVTRAFGTLNAQMVSADAPPSTLRTDVIPGDLLASTPDANWNDPFIQAKAAELGYDPQRIFDYLDNEVGYNSYNGSLRGARGTLWSSAGNALDVASLGVALMRASGIPAQYVSGTLSTSQAQQLILSMFPASYQTVGYIPAGTEVADPANDPKLLAETENHHWFQFDLGNGMTDADPLMPGHTPIGQTFTIASSTFTEVPDNLREKTEVKLTAEVYFQSDAAFGLDPFHRTVVLDQTFNDVDLVGRPLSIGNFVTSNGVGSPVFGVVTNTYSPYIVLGDEAFPSNQADTIRGTDYQEQLTNFPLANQILTGLFLDVTLNGPGGPAEAFNRALVDRIGYATRQGMVTTQVAVDPKSAPAISAFDIYTLNVLSGLQAPGVAEMLQARVSEQSSTVLQQDLATSGATTSILITFSQAALSAFAYSSDQLAGNTAALSSVLGYFDRPSITMFSSKVTTNADQEQLGFHTDLVRTSIRGLVFPGQNTQARRMFIAELGIMKSVLEGLILSSRSTQNLSAPFIIQAAVEQGSSLVVLTADNIGQLQALQLPVEAKARIATAILGGLTVVVPTHEATINGNQTSAWFQIDPNTGEMIGVLQDGSHGGSFADFSFRAWGATITVSRVEEQAFRITFQFAGFTVLRLLVGKAALLAATTGLIALFESALAKDSRSVPILSLIALIDKLKYLTLRVSSVDPPLEPLTSNLNVPFRVVPTNVATNANPISPVIAAGAVVGNGRVANVVSSNQLAVAWTTATASGLQANLINISAATIKDSNDNPVGSGTVALAGATAIPVSISGSNQYSVNGNGSLSFYAPAEASLGVSGNWHNYTATVTGDITITLTTDSLVLNGNLLPAGTYTITTNSATLSGSGLTTSPNFSGSVSIDATDATINLGPGSGNITVGGNPLDPANGVTLTGYSGNITIGGNATDLDAVTIAGNAGNVLTVSATPAALVTDQNTPVTFQVNVNTSFADIYDITAQSPAGWTVTIGSNGVVTATPAAGLQSGTFPIQITARSTTNPELVAQSIVHVTITPTVAGMTLAVEPDALFTVPYNGAQVPTAYQVVIHNNGPAADTYNLSFADVPSGFTLLNSGTSVTIPAGATGIVGVYLQATATLPAPGTPLSFSVTATSTSNPAITQSVTKLFAMPEVHAVTLIASPPTLSSTPGAPVTTTLKLQSVGNVAEDFTLAVAGSAGLTVNGLTPIHLDIGQSMTQTVTLTPAGDAPLNSTLTATFTVPPQPGSEVQPTTTTISLVVRSPQMVAISQAAVEAGQVPNFQLAATLSDLADSVSQLQVTPTDASLLARVRFLLGNLGTLLSADPALTVFVSSLQPLQASDATSLFALAPAFFGSLASTLAIEATQQFTVNLSSTLIDAEPGQSKNLTVELVNTGDEPVTLNLSAPGLPNNVTAIFGQTQVTLAAGMSASVNVTLANTLISAKVFTLQITAAASVSQHSATAVVAIRPAMADVLAVTANPTAVDAGEPVSVSVQVFNTANVARTILVHLDILDSSRNVVNTHPEVSFDLVPGTGVVTLDLGQVATAGLPNGVYLLRASLRAVDEAQLPGRTGQTSLAIGQLVTASITASPQVVAPGTSTVGTTITVENELEGGAPKTVSVVVPGNADPFLAGMPNGSTAGGGDVAPFQSPMIVQNLPLFADDVLTFNVTGSVSFQPVAPTDPPDGNFGFINVYFPENGISSTTAPIDSLLGVFLGPNQPNLLPAPGKLVFSPTGNVPGGLNYLTLAPQLQQLFFIGDGRTDLGQIQQVQVPAGATRLVLATADGFGWYNNGGSFNVQVTNLNPAAGAMRVTHDLPSTGYSVNPGSIQPNATSVTGSHVVWNSPIHAASNQYQLNGIVTNMAPGEVRPISLGTTVTVLAPQTQTTSYTASAGFSATNNPNGAWTFGWTPVLGGAFTPSTVYAMSPEGIELWKRPGDYPVLYPAQFHNSTSNVVNRSGTVYQPGQVALHPGNAGEFAVARWTAPANGTVSLKAIFSGIESIGGTTTDVHVLHSGVAYFHGAVNFFGDSATFLTTQEIPVLTGETIDFAVGYGSNRNFFADSTGADLTVTFTSTQLVDLATITLPTIIVAADHIISLDESVQSVDRGALASYILELKNPYATDRTYLLSSDGLAGLNNDLPASVFVPAGQTVVLPLNVAVPPGMTPGVHVFQVLATTAEGAVDSVEGQLTVSPEVVLNSQAVHVALQQSEGTAGQGTSTTFTLRITNEGNAVDTYNLSALLPAGVTATFSQQTVTVPPGHSNFRDVTVTLTPALGATPGTYSFEVSVASASNASVTATAGGMLEVLANGVSVALNPDADAPGSTFLMTVTNTGQVADTFDLALAGPAFFVASLGTTTVSLAPGESHVFPITTGAVTFAVPGVLPLTALATSQTNSAVLAGATADLSIPAFHGMTAEFDPVLVSLQQVGPASFLLLVHNTGNTEDAYTATITGVEGPVTASLVGLDGQPAQSIPIFRLPGLFTGAILLQTTSTGFRLGRVAVQVNSLSDPGIMAAVTATVTITSPTAATTTTVRSDHADGSTYGQTVIFTATVSADTGTPTGSVQFQIDGTNHGAAVPLTGGTASISTAALPAGQHSIVAFYSSDSSSFSNSDDSASPLAQIVTPASATITVAGYSGLYDGNAHGATGSASGINDEDLSSLLELGATFTNVAGGTAHWTFAGNTNYAPANGDVAIVIGKASINYTISNATHVYGSTVNLAAALGTNIATGVNGENLAITYTSSGNTVTASAGSYAITGAVSDGTGLASNYTVTLTPGTLTVTKATLTGDATTQDALNMAKQGKLIITINNISGLLNGNTLTTVLSTAEYYITVGTNRYVFVPTTVTTSGSSITINYTLKNSALQSQLAAELEDNTSGATAVSAGFYMESDNYTFTDDYLTRLFSTVK